MCKPYAEMLWPVTWDGAAADMSGRGVGGPGPGGGG